MQYSAAQLHFTFMLQCQNNSFQSAKKLQYCTIVNIALRAIISNKLTHQSAIRSILVISPELPAFVLEVHVPSCSSYGEQQPPEVQSL